MTAIVLSCVLLLNHFTFLLVVHAALKEKLVVNGVNVTAKRAFIVSTSHWCRSFKAIMCTLYYLLFLLCIVIVCVLFNSMYMYHLFIVIDIISAKKVREST